MKALRFRLTRGRALAACVLFALSCAHAGAATRAHDIYSQRSIGEVMRRVFEWQVAHPVAVNSDNNNLWARAALYAGAMAAYRGTHDKRYFEQAFAWAEGRGWKLGERQRHADDEAPGQTYLELYLLRNSPSMIADTRAALDAMLKEPRPGREEWWWCDALFMAPPVLARLYAATGERKYLDFMDSMWWDTTDLLFDPAEKLYYRDKSYVGRLDANGRKIFWSRGNGWVMAGTVRVLEHLPEDDPRRGRYVELLRAMAASVGRLQGEDGLWRTSLLDPRESPAPETSGTGFFCYALAWGVNNGHLDRRTYLPVARKAWRGLVNSVRADGKLGWVQQIDAAPAKVAAEDNQEYGSGALLLAGSEMYKLGGARRRAAAPAQPPVVLTAEQDHERMMRLLHITSLRPGADGYNRNAPNAVNYDESKVGPIAKLPDPLVMKDGRRVASAGLWWSKRRAEIVEEFDREIYGRVPKVTPKVSWEVVATKRETNGGVPVVTKELVGRLDNSSYTHVNVEIQLTLTTPADAEGPVPVVMEFGFVFPPGFRLPPPPPGPTWQQQALARGWGYAVYTPATVQPDDGAGLTRGVIGLTNKGRPRGLEDWGALRAWAWGASRALDYFETDRAVDARQVAIEGHSRYGKAALVAMAYDPRFRAAFISSSGEGGAKLHRRDFGERLENVAGAGEYHWMAGNFIKYAGPLTPNDLPVDAHELIALCAPRPVLISAGALSGDGWVDAKGMFLAAAAASPVYELLGARGLGASEFPPIETPLVGGDVAFRQHAGGHTPGPNWPTFLEFAGRYIKARARAAAIK